MHKPQTASYAKSLCLGYMIFLCMNVQGYTDLIYRHLGDVPVYGGTYDLDINEDGETDFVFESRLASQFWMTAQGDNKAVVNGSGDLAPLTNGFHISLSLSDPYTWSTDSVIAISTYMTLPPPEGGVGTGEFFGKTAYMGLQYTVSSEVHYAWARLAHGSVGAGGYLVDLVYETNAGIGMDAGAGAVPEPNSVLLAIIGLMVICIRLVFVRTN